MNETLLDVKGMTCGSCVRHVNEALGRIGGVRKIDVRLQEGRVHVAHDPAVAPASLVAALEEAGYPSQPTR